MLLGALLLCALCGALGQPDFESGRSLVHAGDLASLQQYLAQGGAHTGPGEDSLLLAAAARGQPAMVQSLLQHGADPNVVEADGWSALTFCSFLVSTRVRTACLALLNIVRRAMRSACST